MLKSCCFCFNLYVGSLLVGFFRLGVWLTILAACIDITVQILHPDSAMMLHRTRTDIEANAYLLFLIMLVTFVGITLECLLLHGIYKGKFNYFKLWYGVTLAIFFLSVALAVNFILGILEIPSRPETGKNFFSDAMCVLIHIVFFSIPEEWYGPRLTPVFMSLMILAHLFLPILHAYSLCVVHSHVKTVSTLRYLDELAAAEAEMLNHGSRKRGPHLCQKCALAAEAAAANTNGCLDENEIYRCETTGVKPIETTC